MNQQRNKISISEDMSKSIDGLLRFSHKAMATTFEILAVHKEADYVQQAVQAAFDELDKLEAELSRFIENSDISQINGLERGQQLSISLDSFKCLQLAKRLHKQTNGAFDVTIGSLMDCWLDENKKLRQPTEKELNLARQCTGTDLIKLNENNYTVRISGPCINIDLGGLGKGYAVDKIAELMADWEIRTVLIHGGYSSVRALDGPAEINGWPVTISNPLNRKEILESLLLQRCSVSGSGLEKGRHIIDPKTARPIKGKSATWVYGIDAATADGLSTAFMVMSIEDIKEYCSRHSEISAMVAMDGKILRFGSWGKTK